MVMKAQRKKFSTKWYRLLRRKVGGVCVGSADVLRPRDRGTSSSSVQDIVPEIVELGEPSEATEFLVVDDDVDRDVVSSSVEEIEPEIAGADAPSESTELLASDGAASEATELLSIEVDEVKDAEEVDMDREAPAPRVRISRMAKKRGDRLVANEGDSGSKSESQKRFKSQEIDNPEVSSRLTNMSIRHVGSRPDWFDIEPMSLPGVVRQCHHLYYKIESSLVRKEKQMILLAGREGIGKTTFLAQVYAKLEHAPIGVLTLAPGIPKKSPFRALRNILEQRFYISGKANFACIERFVRSAMAAIIASDGDVDAAEVEKDIDAILEMWRMTRASQKPARVVPPPLKTQVVSMESVIAAHKMQKKANSSKQNSDAESVSGEEAQGKSETRCADVAKEPISATLRVPDSIDIAMDDALVASAIERLVPALCHLLRADLRKNAIVIVIDDAEKYDRYSLEILCKLYEALDAGPLTMLWTVSDCELLPESIRNKSYLERLRLDSMSDTDLTLLTKHVFRRLGESREKKLIPQEICRHIAQRAYGSPKRAIELILEHFKPDQVIHWNEAIEKIRHQSLPQDVASSIVARFKSCDEAEQTLLQVASHLMVPFTCATLQSIVSGLDDGHCIEALRCVTAFKSLRKQGFFDRSEDSLTRMTPTFVFRHDCERIVIAGSTPRGLRSAIYARAAQWYTLINFDGIYDETIGDLWRCNQSLDAACRCYESAAYRAYRQAHYTKAWPLFSKLLKCLPESDLARKIKVSLDSAKIAFRIGLIDEAFRLCRWTCYNATRLSAYAQAAQATLQIAEMLVEIGSTRHVMRYIKRTRALLNVAGNVRLAIELDIVLANYALVLSQRNRVRSLVTKIQSMAKTVELDSVTLHKIALIHASVEYDFGNPLIAIVEFEKLIADCEASGDIRMRAIGYHMLGKAYERSENLSSALESWNRALGLAQEMNDVVLHAAILADIADGALSLEAMRTARVAIEECLGAAQQTRQRDLIARCLANTAYLQYVEGQHDKAMRTLRKAHKSACSLRIMNIWTRTLSLIAWFYRQVDSDLYRPNEANDIYRHLVAIYERYHQPLGAGRIVPEYARFLFSIHQNMVALSQCRKLRSVYQEFGIAQGIDKIDALIDSMNEASDGGLTGDN